MNEYMISFINDAGVYQQLTFRGVTESVATALATGLFNASFSEVSLTVKEYSDRQINVLPGEADPVSDNAEAEGADPGEADLGGTGGEQIPMSGRKRK